MERALEALYENRPDEAERALRKGLEIVPDHPSFLQNLATVYMQRGDEKRAEALIRQIIEDHPDH